MHMGPDFILVNISLKFTPGTDATTIESTIDYMEDRIQAELPRGKTDLYRDRVTLLEQT